MRTNKYFVVLSGFFIIMSFILGIIFRKYALLFLHQSVYFCQGVINALPIRLPENIGEAGILIFMLTLLFLVIKLIATWIKNLRLQKRFECSSVRSVVIEKLGNKLDLHNKILVCRNTRPLAFCFGFIHPKIYLSTGLIVILSKTELEAVLRHEKYHLNNKDSLVGFLATITQSLFPFFPIITYISRDYRIQNEIAADNSAITAMESSSPLISVLRKIMTYEPIKPLTFNSSLAEWDSLEIRIKRLVKKEVGRRNIPFSNILVSLFSLFILGAIVLSPVNALEFHTKEKDFMVLCGSNQNCKNSCEAQVISSFSHN